MRWAFPVPGRRRPMRLKLKIFLLVTGVACLALLLLGAAAVWSAALKHEDDVGRQNLKLALLIASLPEVRSGLQAPDPAAVLQPLTERLRRETAADLIVVFDMQSMRYTHYDPRYINTPYTAGDQARALQGEAYTTKCACVGVHSVRGLAPVRGADGRQLGVVVVGTFVDNVAAGLRQLKLALGFSLAGSLVVATAAAFWVANSIKRGLHGLEPWEIAALLRERETLLHSMREGLVAIDASGRITMVNETAQALIGARTALVGQPADAALGDLRLTELLAGRPVPEDEDLLLGTRVVVCNRVPVTVHGAVAGALVTFRDKTEVTRLAEELTGVHRFAAALRAQNHEFLNRFHTVAGLLHLEAYREAAEYISQVTRGRQETMQSLLAQVREATVAGLLLGKYSEAQEKGVAMVITPDTRLHALPPAFDGHAAICVLGNLIENALEALAGRPGGRRLAVTVQETADSLRLVVADNGPGVAPALRTAIFARGVSSKGPGRGLGLYLASERVRQAGGAIQLEHPPEGGARFTVTIPLRVPAVPLAAAGD